MSQPLHIIVPDKPVERWVMFAVEFLDPITGFRVAEGLRPRVQNLPPPLVNRSGRFVWRLDTSPEKRSIHMDLEIENRMYGPPADPLDFDIEANDGTTPPAMLLKSFTLTTTALYRPPDGMTAAAGRLVKGGGSKDPLPGVEIFIETAHDAGTATFASSHTARTDARGEFVAVLAGLTHEKLDLHASESGALDAWLTLKSGAASLSRNPVPALRRGRLTYLNTPLKWTPDPP